MEPIEQEARHDLQQAIWGTDAIAPHVSHMAQLARDARKLAEIIEDEPFTGDAHRVMVDLIYYLDAALTHANSTRSRLTLLRRRLRN